MLKNPINDCWILHSFVLLLYSQIRKRNQEPLVPLSQSQISHNTWKQSSIVLLQNLFQYNLRTILLYPVYIFKTKHWKRKQCNGLFISAQFFIRLRSCILCNFTLIVYVYDTSLRKSRSNYVFFRYSWNGHFFLPVFFRVTDYITIFLYNVYYCM